jgi:PAS domain S-box-containing protein
MPEKSSTDNPGGAVSPPNPDVALLLEMLELAPASIGLLSGPELRWTYANRSMIRTSGRSRASDLLGKTVREALPEVAGQGYFEMLDEVYRSGRPFSATEKKIVIGNIEGPLTRYVNFVCQPIPGPSGGTDAILIHSVDVTATVISRHALERSEERFRLAQSAAQMGVFEWDPVADTRTLSEELHDIFGTRPDDIKSAEQWLDHAYPQDRARIEANMRGAYTSGEIEFDYRYNHPVRGTRWLYTRGRRLNDSSRLFGVVLDITDRRQAEEILRQKQEDFTRLADSMPHLVWLSDPTGRVYWCNRRWYEYAGLTQEQLEAGGGWKSIFDPETFSVVRERWSEAVERSDSFEMTFRLRGADGMYRPFLSRAVPLRDSDGRVTRWLGTNTEIDAEVRVRRELESSQAQLREALSESRRLAAIVESSHDAIFGRDLNYLITSWNPGAERMFGYRPEEIIGQNILVLIPERLHYEAKDIRGRLESGERITNMETLRRTKAGQEIEVSLTVSAVRDLAGTVVGMATIARDITMRNQAERALRTTERLASVGRLAATVAHEINNPLEAVSNLVYLARMSDSVDATRGFLAQAEEELSRVSVLTRQTLGFYRETRGTSLVSLRPIIESLLSVYAPRLRNKAIRLDTQIRDDVPIYAVPGEVRQLLANLLNNSLDALEPGGRIVLRVSGARSGNPQAQPGVRLTVADTGSGIPAEVRSQLFQPFFTTKKEIGTGLGLWVCASIVEKRGGSLRLKSSTHARHHGTVLSIFLPVEPADSTDEMGTEPGTPRRELSRQAGRAE